jgi:hypothetical protein
VLDHAKRLAADPAIDRVLADKRSGRERVEAEKSLKAYRDEEFERMRLAFMVSM